MITILTVFLMKFADCSLGTMKTVFLCKEKYFISAILNSVSAALFIFVADAMANSPSDMKMFIALDVFLANLLGGYFPPKLLDKVEADQLFVYVVTSDTLENGKAFADQLRELNIAVATTIVYNSKLNKVLTCKCYSNTKNESKMIENNIPDTFKHHIIQAI